MTLEEQEEQAVDRLGRSIGFGRMMQVAEQCWRKLLLEDGGPAGGESTKGIPRAMLDNRGFKDCMELLEAYDKLAEK